MAATPTPSDRHLVVLGPDAQPVRRTVGPIAWAVLEHLAETATDRGGETVSHETVRGVADALGLAKDTVARALRRLANERLVTFVACRSDDGRFGPTHYRLTLPSDLFIDHTCTTPISTRVPAAHSPRHRLQVEPTQLSLIDPGSGAP